MPGRDRLGRVPSPPDARDHPLSRYVDVPRAAVQLPRSLVPYTPTMPVYDQVGPSCVGNSRALQSTIDQRRDHRRTLIYDGEELYAACKQVDGYAGDGTYPRTALKISQERGVLVARSRLAREVGDLDVIAAYAALHTIEEIKVAIHLYGSAMLGSTWYDEWDIVPVGGVLPVGVRAAGGHAYVAIGWSDHRASLLIQNSWSAHWGRRIGGRSGRAWLPYERVDFADFEAWRSIDLQGD